MNKRKGSSLSHRKVEPYRVKFSDIVIVTSSENKLAEINQILGTNHKVSTLDIPEIQSLDLDEVITQKAKDVYQKIKKPVLVEDISFEIKALKGLPGTFIKFFLETVGTEGTVKMLGGSRTDTKVTAAYALYDGKNLKFFKGVVTGTLSKKNKGPYGFGFDKIFIPKGYTKTYGQMPPRVKNKISHRALALQKIKSFLIKQG